MSFALEAGSDPMEPPRNRPTLAAVLALVTGLGVLAGQGIVELNVPPAHPLASSLIVLDTEAPGGQDAWAAQIVPDLEWAAMLDANNAIEIHEWMIATELNVFEAADLLVQGRMPEEGANEILAGPYTTRQSVDLGGIEYAVVGRLSPGVRAFSQCYVLSQAAQGPPPSPWTSGGSFYTQGKDYFDGFDSLAEITPASHSDTFIAGRVPASQTKRWLSFAALLLITGGGAFLQVKLIVWLLRFFPTWAAGFLQAMEQRPLALFRLHLLLYGVFFFWMAVGMDLDKVNFLFTVVVQQLFETGNYQYIGDAYGSGNILLAAWATFYNNFILQTAVFTLLPSLIPICLGIAKTAFSLALAGFVLAPIWDGGAFIFAFHSITVALELEAYIFACFGVWLWTVHCYRALLWITPMKELRAGAAHLLTAMGLAAVMLALAALYEAATLITLAG